MRHSKRLRILREQYATIPEVHCKGLCVAACAAVPLAPLEQEQLEAALGRPLYTTTLSDGTVLLGDLGQPCPLLVMGGCSAYANRPTICRLYGAAEGLPCPHGCVPDRVMTDVEARKVIQRVGDLW